MKHCRPKENTANTVPTISTAHFLTLVSFILHSLTWRSSAPLITRGRVGWKDAQLTPLSWPSSTYFTIASLPPTKIGIKKCVKVWNFQWKLMQVQIESKWFWWIESEERSKCLTTNCRYGCLKYYRSTVITWKHEVVMGEYGSPGIMWHIRWRMSNRNLTWHDRAETDMARQDRARRDRIGQDSTVQDSSSAHRIAHCSLLKQHCFHQLVAGLHAQFSSSTLHTEHNIVKDTYSTI